MSKSVKVEDSVTELVLPLLADTPFSLYDVEFVKEGDNHILRIYIDKENGIDLDDCEQVTNLLNDPLDDLDPISENYLLEVSSPGIERHLRTRAHFEGAIGSKIYLKTFAPIDGKKEFNGILNNVEDENIKLETKGGFIEIPWDKIAKAHISVF